jgi:CspA family cold shock protein
MARGKVKWFNDSKGFGFIERLDGSGEVFVHYTSILPLGIQESHSRRTLSDGQEVEFDLYEGAKGLQAENVRLSPRLRV